MCLQKYNPRAKLFKKTADRVKASQDVARMMKAGPGPGKLGRRGSNHRL